MEYNIWVSYKFEVSGIWYYGKYLEVYTKFAYNLKEFKLEVESLIILINTVK